MLLRVGPGIIVNCFRVISRVTRSASIGSREVIEVFLVRIHWLWGVIRNNPSGPRPPSLCDAKLQRGAMVVAAGAIACILIGIFKLDPLVRELVLSSPEWLRQTGDWVTGWLTFGVWIYVFVGVTVAGVIWRREMWVRWALFGIIAMATCGILTNLLKITFARQRPSQGAGVFRWFEVGYAVNSFPSGHSTDAGVLFMVAWLIYRPLGWVVLPIALAFASTRMLTHSHWLSDVVGGFTIGAMGTLALHAAFVYKDHVRQPRKPSPDADSPSGT